MFNASLPFLTFPTLLSTPSLSACIDDELLEHLIRMRSGSDVVVNSESRHPSHTEPSRTLPIGINRFSCIPHAKDFRGTFLTETKLASNGD
jgi:hypothetical protein